MPALPTQPLRDEHKELLPHIVALRAAADSVGAESVEVVLRNASDAHAFLAGHLLVHAQAEEKALYPVVARLMGAPGATGTMRRDHVEIAHLTDQLGQLVAKLGAASTLSKADASELRALLYGLSTLVGVHFAKEEEVYLPILDSQLTSAEAHKLFEAMESAASEARSQS